MNQDNRTIPLGVIRPAAHQETHELKITLLGHNDGSTWSATLEIDMRPTSPPKLLIFELPDVVKKPTGRMHQSTNNQSEFVVRLVGTATPATLHDLSQAPLEDWMATMFQMFARCPASVAVLCNQGRISVALHEGEA